MTRIQLRHDTATNWTTANPILAEGEAGFETDTNKFKIGDGVTNWNNLAYQSGSGGGGGDLSNYYTKAETDSLLKEKANDFVVENPLTLKTPTTSSISFNTYDKGEVNYNYETGEYYYGFAEDRTTFQIIIDIPKDINIDVYNDYWKIGDSSISFSRTQPNTKNNSVFEVFANNGTDDVTVARLWYGSGNYRVGSSTTSASSPFGTSLGIHKANTTIVNMKSTSVKVSSGYESNIVAGSRLSKIVLYCMCQCAGDWGADFSSASWGNYWSDSSGARLKSLKLYTSADDTEGIELIRYSVNKPTINLNIDTSLTVQNNLLGVNTSEYYTQTQVDTLLNNKVGSCVSLLDFKWSDHLLNNESWLRADTFSWQDGTTYDAVYTHLVQDIQGLTAETETIGSYTVTFYRATDGHKICLADQEQTVLNIYNETGIAWYYIVDTTNVRFKLPRTKYGFEGLRTNVGDKIDESLPNIKTGRITTSDWGNIETQITGAWEGSSNPNSTNLSPGNTATEYFLSFNASRSSSTYQDGAPVQERATQMYLYFYVGDYTQTAVEQTAGLNAELFNGKVDLNFDNMNPSQTAKDTIISWGMPDYSAGIDIGTADKYEALVDGYYVGRVVVNSGTAGTARIIINIYDNSDTIMCSASNSGYDQTVGNTKYASITLPVPKGYKISVIGVQGILAFSNFYPMKGAN